MSRSDVPSVRTTSTTSSSEIVNDTPTAISHETPRSPRLVCCPRVESPATTTPVITLITGAAASSQQPPAQRQSGRIDPEVHRQRPGELLEHGSRDHLDREVADDQPVGQHDGAGGGQDEERVPRQVQLPGGERHEREVAEQERVPAHLARVLERERPP